MQPSICSNGKIYIPFYGNGLLLLQKILYLYLHVYFHAYIVQSNWNNAEKNNSRELTSYIQLCRKWKRQGLSCHFNTVQSNEKGDKNMHIQMIGHILWKHVWARVFVYCFLIQGYSFWLHYLASSLYNLNVLLLFCFLVPAWLPVRINCGHPIVVN